MTAVLDFEMPEPSRLMVAGDWHKHLSWAEKAIAHAHRAGCDAILHAGDFGYWPRYPDSAELEEPPHCPFSERVHDLCEEVGIPLYWVDGNHEHHHLLVPGQGDRWLRHLPRGHRWRWWGKTWMAVGGGVSVDKNLRTPGFDWFPEEALTMAQFAHCTREGKVDIIISHDCPSSVPIPGIHAGAKHDSTIFPPELVAASDQHRAFLAAIVEQTTPGYLFHGHYHDRYNGEYVYEGSDEVCKVIGLDKNGTHLNLNTAILTAEDLP